MELHTVRGFNPLNGREIVSAICGSLRGELEKHDFLSQHLAYPVAKWTITAVISLASSAHSQPDTTTLNVAVGYEQTDDQGVPVPTDEPKTETVETEHEVEFPDLTREQFIAAPAPPEPESANSAVAPTAAGMESYPEKFGKRAGR